MATLYGAPLSPFVRKVRVLLHEKNINYKLEVVIPFQVTPEYKKISPLGKIPAYEDENGTLPDSSVICAYLEKLKPKPSMYPDAPYAYARALWFEEFADGALPPMTNIFFQKIVNPKFFHQPCDETIIARALNEQLPPLWDYLDLEMEHKSFLVEDKFTIADAAIASPFVNLQHAGFSVDEKKWPHLSRYVASILNRDIFKQLIAEEEAFLRG